MTIVVGSGFLPVSWEVARNKVRGDLWRPGPQGVPDDQVDRALHAALRKLESERRWLWLQNIPATITATAQGAELPRPADSGVVNAIAYLSGSTGYDLLTATTLQAVRSASRGTYVGSPSAYSLAEDRIHLDCRVAVGATFEISYRARTPLRIEAAIQAPPVTLSLHTAAVVALACAQVALTYLKNEAEAARHQAAYRDMLDTLFSVEDDARADEHGGFIAPDNSLHIAAYGSR